VNGPDGEGGADDSSQIVDANIIAIVERPGLHRVLRQYLMKKCFNCTPYRLGVAHISMLKALEIRNFSF
jgi:hypothetical protein